MSEWPSPLKSPVPIAFQLGPGIGADAAAADQFVPVHFPDRDLAAGGVLKQDIGMTVVIEIAGSDRFPSRPGLGADGPAADQGVPVHFPDRGLTTARVLKQDVGMAVVIEIAGSDRFPAWSRIGAHGPAADEFVPVHFPNCRPSIGILQQDIRGVASEERAGAPLEPGGAGVWAEQFSGRKCRAVQLPQRQLPPGVLQYEIQVRTRVRTGGSAGGTLTDTWLVAGADVLTPSLTDQVIVRLELVAWGEA